MQVSRTVRTDAVCGNWFRRHTAFAVATARRSLIASALIASALAPQIVLSAPQVVFVGDETVSRFTNVGGGEWYKYFKNKPFEALNIGHDGETTSSALKRISDGAMKDVRPKAVVVSVGANDLDQGRPVFDVVVGIRDVVRAIQAKDSMIRIVLSPIFPQGRERTAHKRIRANAVNRELQRYANGRNVVWVDWTDRILTADGMLPIEASADGRWPSRLAYDIWGSTLIPYLDAASEGRRMPGSLFPSRMDRYTYPVDTPLVRIPQGRFCEYSSKLGSDWWAERVLRNRRQGASSNGSVDLVMVGDSITHFLERPGPKGGSNVLERIRAKYSVMVCGDAGDKTQNVLWRVRYGELDGFSAKVITLMIGTNNAYSKDRPEDTAAAIGDILAEIAVRQPDATVVLMPIFPRGKTDDGFRKLNESVNSLIRKYADGKRVRWLDIGPSLVDANGDVPLDMAADRLHPTEKGYGILFKAMMPILKSVCGK